MHKYGMMTDIFLLFVDLSAICNYNLFLCLPTLTAIFLYRSDNVNAFNDRTKDHVFPVYTLPLKIVITKTKLA
jgi:hypothetical protein